MPRYYCDYCDTYLTHDSPSVRKQHNAGYKHKANVRTYYQQFEAQQTQILIDQRIKEHLGQAAAYQQVGAAYNQHLMARPRMPMMPMGPNGQLPMNAPFPGMRPPVLPFPRPGPGVPGYAPLPNMPPMMAPPGAPNPSVPQMNGFPRPPTLSIPPQAVPGTPTSGSGGTPSMAPPPPFYEPNPTSGRFDSSNANSILADAADH